MRVRQVRRPPVRLVAAAGFLLLAVALGALAAAQSAAPAGGSLLRAVSKPIPSRLPDGCGDAALTDGVNNRPEILCGTTGADVIRAGIADRVKASNGKDTIYARNGAPNEIDGGADYDIAYVDKGKLDRSKGIQKRYTAMRRPNSPASGRLVTPKKFPYELPTVECDDDDEGPGRHILLHLPGKPQMAAYDANPGVVDWQNVTWATVIYKYDRQAKKWNVFFESEWLWDRTYDLPDYKKHPPNVWRSFIEGEDDDAAPQEPFAVVEPGFYNVRFRYFWYAETLADLTDMPKEYLFTPARKLLGKYAAGGVAANQRYCNFP
jgi:hypothetical protein